MKEQPEDKPEPSEADKFRALTQRVLSVPKTEIERREAEYKKERGARQKSAK